MPSDKTPVTKSDLNVIGSEIKLLRELMESELGHLKDEVSENTAWRQEFLKEDGPWRRMNSRVKEVEYLARTVKWIVAAITPIALWAIIEMIKAGAVALR